MADSIQNSAISYEKKQKGSALDMGQKEANGERFNQVSRVVRLFGFHQYMIKKVLSQTEWVKSLSLEGRGLGEGD